MLTIMHIASAEMNASIPIGNALPIASFTPPVMATNENVAQIAMNKPLISDLKPSFLSWYAVYYLFSVEIRHISEIRGTNAVYRFFNSF